MRGCLHVFSCGTTMPLPVREACRDMDLVLGSKRLLAELVPGEGQEFLPLSGNVRESLEGATGHARKGKRVALLASGDALFHGIGATLLQVLGRDPYTIHQNPSFDPGFDLSFHEGPAAFQTLCAKIGLAWDQARFFSVHSCTLDALPLRDILEAELAVVYTGHPATPELLARALCALSPASGTRRCVVGSRLGCADERIDFLSLKELSHAPHSPTSVVLLLPDGQIPQTLPLGLGDEAYAYEKHCITHKRIRPLVLASLELPARGVFWDLGAGAGTVGIEAGLLQKGLFVHAVEQNPVRCHNIRTNAQNLGLNRIEVHEGDILDVLPSLPSPDRVMLGGGGARLPFILEKAYARLAPEGIMVATAVTLESLAILTSFSKGLPAKTSDFFSVDVQESAHLGQQTMLRPLHRIHIFIFKKLEN